MKKIASVVFQLAVFVVGLAMVPAVNAQDRFKFEVGYNATSHRTTFEYLDADYSFVSGTKFEGNGIHASGSAKLSEIVSVVARFDHNFNRRPEFFDIGTGYSHSGPNGGERTGASQRVEAVVGFRLPVVGTLEGGVARHSFARRWTWNFPPPPSIPPGPQQWPRVIHTGSDTVSWGPVVGLTREIRIKRVTLDGGFWGYPRMAQGQARWEDRSGSRGWNGSETASAVRAEATVAYHLTSRLAVKTGYSFFRTFTADPNPGGSGWWIDTIRAEHAVIARLAFVF